MTTPDAKHTARRYAALSAEMVVEAAIEILDESGEDGLTIRTLAKRLETGPGAIYHYLPNKQAVMDDAALRLMRRTIAGATGTGQPQAMVMDLMLGLFDMVDEHPWIGGQLATAPWQPPAVTAFDAIGANLDRVAVRPDRRFSAATALLNYLIGVSAQYAAAARITQSDRGAFLAAVATEWSRPHYQFAGSVSKELEVHDEREQFRKGVAFLLDGILSSRP